MWKLPSSDQNTESRTGMANGNAHNDWRGTELDEDYNDLGCDSGDFKSKFQGEIGCFFVYAL